MQVSTKIIKNKDSETIAKYHNKLTSPIIINQTVYSAAQNGDILKFNLNGQTQIVFTLLGQPSSILYRDAQEYFLVSDFAHQSIFARDDSRYEQIHNLISEYNNRAFLGPNSMRIGPLEKNLYFTDSGPFMQTSIQNKQGSVFIYHLQTESVSCLTFHTLAYPSGLECDEQEKFLIVSETGMNRLIKFYLNQNQNQKNYTVFHQFSGRMGPTAIARFDDCFYVALFEFEYVSRNGMVAVVNSIGEMIEKFIMPTGPEITGLFIDQKAMSGNSSCSFIYISEGCKIHKISLKGGEGQKMGESMVKLY